MESIKVEGVRELTRAIAKADSELVKEFAKANKQIGEAVIAALFPKPDSSGAGRGSEPRAIASRNYVGIAVGRSERAKPIKGKARNPVAVRQWGSQYVKRDQPRPFILGAALKQFPHIENDYLDAVERVLKKISAD